MNLLISTDDATALILEAAKDLGSEPIALENATGRKLTKALIADRPLPPFDRAMMDGIAFSSTSLTDGEFTTLEIQGLHPAGSPKPENLRSNSCWEIMTGAYVPEDCDTLIPYEEVKITANTASFPNKEAIQNRFIHRAGSDYPQESTLVTEGAFLGSREIAIAASIGATTLHVTKLPRIAIVTTGDELIPINQQPEPHQIRQSNGHTITAALNKLGISHSSHHHLIDDQGILTEQLQHIHSENDLIIICGGISKGKKDFVRPVLEKLLGEPKFHGVSQKPGKPLAFWESTSNVFALPGNPMSVLTTFHRYVIPLLVKMGVQAPLPYPVRLAKPFSFEPQLTAFIPVLISNDDGILWAQPQLTKNSGDFASARNAQGFIELQGKQTHFSKGDTFLFYPWL